MTNLQKFWQKLTPFERTVVIIILDTKFNNFGYLDNPIYDDKLRADYNEKRLRNYEAAVQGDTGMIVANVAKEFGEWLDKNPDATLEETILYCQRETVSWPPVS